MAKEEDAMPKAVWRVSEARVEERRVRKVVNHTMADGDDAFIDGQGKGLGKLDKAMEKERVV